MYSNNYQVLCIFMDFLNVLSPNYKAMIQPHHTKHSLSCQQVQYEDLYNSTTIYKRTLTILQNIKNEAYSLFLLPNEFSHQSHIILWICNKSDHLREMTGIFCSKRSKRADKQNKITWK